MVLGAGTGVLTARHFRAAPEPVPDIQGLLWPDPKLIGPFRITRDDGSTTGPELLHGSWSLLFFGYTNCPDICPLTLSVLGQAYPALQAAAAGAKVQVIFVSVDPGRDSTQRIAEYVHYFNPAFIGLGGPEAQLGSLARQFGVAYFSNQPAADGTYAVDHSAAIFVVDPAGRFVGVLSAPHRREQVVARFASMVSFINSRNG